MNQLGRQYHSPKVFGTVDMLGCARHQTQQDSQHSVGRSHRASGLRRLRTGVLLELATVVRIAVPRLAAEDPNKEHSDALNRTRPSRHVCV